MENPEFLNQRLNEYYRSNEANGTLNDISGGPIAQEFGNRLSSSEHANTAGLLESTARRESNSYRGAKLTSFSDLYERAVKNVLNIRPFLEDTDDKLKLQSLLQSEARNEASCKDALSKDKTNFGKFQKVFEKPFTPNGTTGTNDLKEKTLLKKGAIKEERVTSNEESQFHVGVYHPRAKDGTFSNGFFSHVLSEHARYFSGNANYIPPFTTRTLYHGYEQHFDHVQRPASLYHPLYGMHGRWLSPYHHPRDISGHNWPRHSSVTDTSRNSPGSESVQSHRQQGAFHLKPSSTPPVSDNSSTISNVHRLNIKQEFPKVDEQVTEAIYKPETLEEDDKSSRSQSPINESASTEKENSGKRSDNEGSRSRLKDSQARMKYRPYGLRSRTSFLNQTIELKGKLDNNKRKDNKLLDLKKKNLSAKERYLLYLGLFKVKPSSTKLTNSGPNGHKQTSSKQGSKYCKEK